MKIYVVWGGLVNLKLSYSKVFDIFTVVILWIYYFACGVHCLGFNNNGPARSTGIWSGTLINLVWWL